MAKGIGLPPGPVQRQHQLAPDAFSQRGGPHCRLQFRHEVGVPAAGKVRLNPFLENREPLLRQPLDFRPGEIFVSKISQRLAAP
jgi:hypothetical protein